MLRNVQLRGASCTMPALGQPGKWGFTGMAERNTANRKRGEVSKGPAQAAPDAALQAENAALKSELEQARARIAELEQRQAEILNRIDWAIDSLHNLRG